MLVHRHASRIRGVLSCFDRILITGTLPDICHAKAFTRELNRRHVRIFDVSRFAEPLRNAIRENADGAQLSRQIKRLRMHHLVKRVRGTYKYYLTQLGRRAIVAAFRLREGSVIPALAGLPA